MTMGCDNHHMRSSPTYFDLITYQVLPMPYRRPGSYTIAEEQSMAYRIKTFFKPSTNFKWQENTRKPFVMNQDTSK